MLNQRFRAVSVLVCAALLTACTSPLLPTTMALPTSNPSLSPEPTQTVETVVQVTPAVAIVAASPTVILTATSTPAPTQAPTSAPSNTPDLASSGSVDVSGSILGAASAPVPTSVPAPTSTSAPDAVVASAEGLNLRSGPGTYFEPPLTLLETNTPLRILAQSPDLLWYKVETPTGQQGWAFSRLLTVSNVPPDLPIEAVSAAQPTTIVIDPSGIQPLNTSPYPNVVTDRMRQVFALGQQLGNDPRVFIKVGDSVTDQAAFMIGFGTGEYNLGSYTSLQASIDYFSHDAFARDSLAAEPGFNSASVLDSFRVPEEGKDICQPGEKPLECEIRVMKPSFAFVLFGGNEVRSSDMGLDVYSNQIQQIIDLTTSRGVIPVLTTFPHAANFHPNAASYNAALRSLAADQQIPLIDLEVAVQSLPNEGVNTEDGFHLSKRGPETDHWIMLNGEEKQYGTTLRDLLTLQMLDSLRIGLGLR